jgi:solute carrier family 29 (equilibrative nucleoside transporter), member 1/2/3
LVFSLVAAAWEETNLPNDELNFKGMTMERAKMEIDPPTDKYKLVFFTLIIHGIGTLMPWNMFITAKSVSFE